MDRYDMFNTPDMYMCLTAGYNGKFLDNDFFFNPIHLGTSLSSPDFLLDFIKDVVTLVK